ncbi:MAG TPA: hypothetical protein DG753_13690 [Clostridium sp.]|nr:hypothetical protein [Clostridium sp.]
MNKEYEYLYKKIMINYIVIFKDNYDCKVGPIIYDDEVEHMLFDNIHLFDDDLIPILPAIEFIMHLPRVGFDVINIDAEHALSSYDTPHNITLLPLSKIELLRQAVDFCQTLIIYQSDCGIDLSNLNSENVVGIISTEMLSTELLKLYWEKFAQRMREFSEGFCVPDNLKMFKKKELLALPLLFNANHLSRSNEVFSMNININDCFKNIYEESFHIHNTIIAASKLNSVNDDFNDLYKKSINETMIPIIISMPGRARYSKNIKPLDEQICRIISVHRAIAKDGIVIETEQASEKLFELLDHLEQHCKTRAEHLPVKDRTTDNKFIWDTLSEIGKKLTELIGEERLKTFNRTNHITVFSDFPIGLGIFPNASAPLCCYKPISYRPLTPLTKAMQYELNKQNQYYIGRKCKVIIAECLDENDDVRKWSNIAWRTLLNDSKKYKGIDVFYSQINSIEELKHFTKENKDSDILIISSHGFYDKKNNCSGLCIGKKHWLADDDDLEVPPIVMLSACHVSPRGFGAVSVADLLLRSGAKTVLGTFVPVNVIKNAILMNRLFVYINEAQKGSKQYRTLLDAWTGVVSTNAINEILSSSPKLKAWAYRKRKNGKIPLVEFEQEKCKNRLRTDNIYEDTTKVLREMLMEDRMDEYFDSLLSSTGYYPESIFYQLIGYPENVFLYNEYFDNID